MGYIIHSVSSFLQDKNTKEFIESEKRKKGNDYNFAFKLLDADGIVYFRGLSNKKWTFEPLDDFGISYGCTEIKYWSENKYETT